MPRYTFECATCQVRFDRTLKIGDHTGHPCPSCSEAAPRVMEGFAFQFSANGSAPGNTGVHDHDYPTADKIVGRDADARRELHAERDKAKSELRKKAGTSGLSRVNHKDGSIEYTAMPKPIVEARRKVADEAVQVLGGGTKATK